MHRCDLDWIILCRTYLTVTAGTKIRFGSWTAFLIYLWWRLYIIYNSIID